MAQTILIIDDHPFFRSSIDNALKELGFKIVEAENGKEGIIVADRERPDLIILDVAMPVMGGMEACERLKADKDLRSIPILMFTANNSKDDVVKAINAGADDFAIKTAGMPLVIEKVKKLLGSD